MFYWDEHVSDSIYSANSISDSIYQFISETNMCKIYLKAKYGGYNVLVEVTEWVWIL